MKLRNASPRFIASRLDAAVQLPKGQQERFSGYGVLGLPFDTGHVLALRKFASSSVGPGYVSVWHRTPEGSWTFYSDIEPSQACTRYFGSQVDKVLVSHIGVDWTGPQAVNVSVPEVSLEWAMQLSATPVTRALNLAGAAMPDWLWRRTSVLSLMSRMAGWALDVGNVSLHGCAPNGQSFIANPRILWSVASSSAVLRGESLGYPAPLEKQAQLGDFWIPNRGVFAFGQAYFERFDEARHQAATSRTDQVALANVGD
jgi:hypothetical protein